MESRSSDTHFGVSRVLTSSGRDPHCTRLFAVEPPRATSKLSQYLHDAYFFEITKAETYNTDSILSPFMWVTEPSPKDIIWFIVPTLSVVARHLKDIHPEATCVVIVTKPTRMVEAPSNVTVIHYYTDGTPARDVDLCDAIYSVLHSRPRVSWSHLKSKLEVAMSPWHVSIVGPKTGYVGFETH